MILALQNCSVTGWNEVTWTISAASASTITLTSNPSGTSGLASTTGCLIENDFQGLDVGWHGYDYTMSNDALINATNNGEYSEFSSIVHTELSSHHRWVTRSGNTNLGMVYDGPSDSIFFEDRTYGNGYEGKVFKDTLFGSANTNGAYGAHLVGSHDFYNGLTGTPGYSLDIETMVYFDDVEAGNEQNSGTMLVSGNDSACGSIQGTNFSAYTGTGDGITFENCPSGTAGSFSPPFDLDVVSIYQKTNGINFGALTTNFSNLTLSNASLTNNTGTNLMWPSGATTAVNSSVQGSLYANAGQTNISGTQPTGISLNLPYGGTSTGALLQAPAIWPVAQGGTGVTASQGNGSKVQLSSGSTTTNDCVKFDANGNTVDSGSACSGGGGGGNTTSASLTTNTLPLANGPNSIINSLVTDNGTNMSYNGNQLTVLGGGSTCKSVAVGTSNQTITSSSATPLTNLTFTLPATNSFYVWNATIYYEQTGSTSDGINLYFENTTAATGGSLSGEGQGQGSGTPYYSYALVGVTTPAAHLVWGQNSVPSTSTFYPTTLSGRINYPGATQGSTTFRLDAAVTGSAGTPSVTIHKDSTFTICLANN